MAQLEVLVMPLLQKYVRVLTLHRLFMSTSTLFYLPLRVVGVTKMGDKRMIFDCPSFFLFFFLLSKS